MDDEDKEGMKENDRLTLMPAVRVLETSWSPEMAKSSVSVKEWWITYTPRDVYLSRSIVKASLLIISTKENRVGHPFSQASVTQLSKQQKNQQSKQCKPKQS
jgi:hypothetical protein